MDRIKTWWEERPLWQKIGLAVIAISVAIGPFIETESDDATEASQPIAAASTTVAESSTTTEDPTTTTSSTTTTSTSTTTTSTTTTTTIPPLDVAVSGTGDDVADLSIPGNRPAVLSISYAGQGNFAIWSYDTGGDRIDLLVNEIGQYEGRRPINFLSGEDVAFLEISASGAWTITASYLDDPSNFDSSTVITGRGAYVVVSTVLNQASGASRVSLTHDGDSNFAVWAWGESRSLIVNEIGPYDGTVLVQDGLYVLDIQADGNWTIDLSG